MKRLPGTLVLILLTLLIPGVATAHHGGISLALGPGSPIETNSPLTLPEGGLVVSSRVEQVAWRQFDFAEPENKSSFTFLNLGLSYGIKPYLSGSVFMPYAVKRQDSLGSNEGFGDLKLLFTLGFNHAPGKGFSLNTSDDTAVTLEGTRKTYFSFHGGFTLATGKSHEELGGEIDRGMQPGFRSPTYTVGAALARQIVGPFTLVADAGYEVFTKKDSFKFGNELRIDLAGVCELYGKPERFVSKIDGVLEWNLLNIARDEENGEGQQATGGTILYLSPGFRFSFPKMWNANLALLLKIPVWKKLNEKSEQQGAEGLERYRAVATLSFFF
jgi:hypothetical protein